MKENKLKLDREKTDFIIISSRYHKDKVSVISIDLNGDIVVKS